MAEAIQITQVRRRIGDKLKSTVETFEYTGNNAIRLAHGNISAVSVAIGSNTVAADKYTVEAVSGTLIFAAGVAQGEDVIVVTYSYAAYSDAELSELIDTYGEHKAVIEIINELLADSAKMFDYSAGGNDAKQSQIFKNLKDLLGIYTASETSVDPVAGGFGTMRRDFGKTRDFYEPDISRQDC